MLARSFPTGGGPQLADFSVLAETSHRLNNPGRTRDEARALLSMAVLLENAQVCAHTRSRLEPLFT